MRHLALLCVTARALRIPLPQIKPAPSIAYGRAAFSASFAVVFDSHPIDLFESARRLANNQLSHHSRILEVIIQVAEASVNVLVPDRGKHLFRQVHRQQRKALWSTLG